MQRKIRSKAEAVKILTAGQYLYKYKSFVEYRRGRPSRSYVPLELVVMAANYLIANNCKDEEKQFSDFIDHLLKLSIDAAYGKRE